VLREKERGIRGGIGVFKKRGTEKKKEKEEGRDHYRRS